MGGREIDLVHREKIFYLSVFSEIKIMNKVSGRMICFRNKGRNIFHFNSLKTINAAIN